MRRNELQAFGFGPAMFNHWARENDGEVGNIQGSYVTCCLYIAEISKEESVKALVKYRKIVNVLCSWKFDDRAKSLLPSLFCFLQME